jgi:hypothetical protein
VGFGSIFLRPRRKPGPVERMIDFLAGRIFLLIVVKDQIRYILGLPQEFTSIYLRVGRYLGCRAGRVAAGGAGL